MRARPCKEKDIRRQRCRRISFFIEGQCLSESILYGGTAWESKRFVRRAVCVEVTFGCQPFFR